MATINVNTLLPQVSPFVARCPENLQLLALRRAAREFALDTEAIEETLADIASVSEQAEYTLIPEYAEMNFKRVVTAYLNPDGADYDKTGEISSGDWAFDGNVTLTLDPAPNVDDYDIQVTVVYEPQMTFVLYPDYLMNRWGEYIAWNALYILRRDPINTDDPVPWFDPTAAMIAKGNYDRGVGDVKELQLSRNQSGRINAIQLRDFT